jgi:tRNA(Ile)-lysidine synthase
VSRCYNPLVYEKVTQTIQRFQLFTLDDPIVIGVSGGADSLSLMDCLTHLGYSVIVAHLDHQLRSESSAEADYVREVCARYEIPFILEVQAIGDLSKQGGSLEETARLVRYNFLADVAQNHGSHCVAVGHTADDQVETILMHLLRGSGPEGLQGMLPKTRFSQWIGIETEGELDLARPLIECTRADTVKHCQQLGLSPMNDPSNEDTAFYRNRIRHELLPLLETYNPGVRQIILRLSDVMREQVSFNQIHVDAAWPSIMTRIGAEAFAIEVGAFKALHPFMQRVLIRRAISSLAPTLRDISHEATLRAVSWMESDQGPLSLPGGLCLEWFGEKLILKTVEELTLFEAFPQMIVGAELKLSSPGEVALAHGWRISARIETRDAKRLETLTSESGHRIAAFCAEHFPTELTIRSRKPGDRITLPSVEGSTKVADLMINRKIPRQTRACWPLAISGDEVLWVPGVQRSNAMLIRDETSQVIVLELHPPDEVSHVDSPL